MRLKWHYADFNSKVRKACQPTAVLQSADQHDVLGTSSCPLCRRKFRSVHLTHKLVRVELMVSFQKICFCSASLIFV